MDGSFKTLFFEKCSEAAKLHGGNFASGSRAGYSVVRLWNAAHHQATNFTRNVYVLATPLHAAYCGVYVAARAISNALASKPSLPDERAIFASVTLPEGSSDTSIAAVPFTRLARASAVMLDGSGVALNPAGAFGRVQPMAGSFAVAMGCGVGVTTAAAPGAYFPPGAVRCGGETLE
jgi:hypothetical protein